MAGIRYQLDDASPKYRQLIPEILDPLVAKYPKTPLRRVLLFRGHPDDRSLANTVKHAINLNSFWFSCEPAVLQEAARAPHHVMIGGHRIAWHGEMVEQPLQVLVHEFGHSLQWVCPGWKVFATEGRKAGLKNPGSVYSGYSLVDPDEFWADAFTAMEFGLADKALADGVRAVLKQD